MSIGTANLKSTLVTGNTLAAEQVDDLSTLVSRADDESLYDLIDLEPPAAATATNVNVGYVALRSGPLVTPDAFSRLVWVAPSRWCRSSISTVTPRRMLSATLDGISSIAMPTAAPFGKWGIELLYAQLAYVDPTEPAKGAQVTFHWATAPTYVNTGTAATPAVLPANTSTTWNVPVAYVKNIAGATAPTQHDILSPTPSTAGGLDGKLRRRIGAGSIDARRGYSSSAQSLATLAAANAITNAVTPAKVNKGDAELVVRSFNIPASMTGASGGVVYTDLDDTRDWRNATFTSFWNIACLSGAVIPLYLGEEDAATGAATDRQAPVSLNNAVFPAQYTLWGQSFEEWPAPWVGHSNAGTAAVTGTNGTSPTSGTPFFQANATNSISLAVETSTGKLQMRRDITAAVAGGPVSILLFATFPNSR